MKSAWYEYKQYAINLRKEGYSLRQIHQATTIPKSTLSGWFKDIQISESQKFNLEQNRISALHNFRAKSHVTQRLKTRLKPSLLDNIEALGNLHKDYVKQLKLSKKFTYTNISATAYDKITVFILHKLLILITDTNVPTKQKLDLNGKIIRSNLEIAKFINEDLTDYSGDIRYSITL